MSFILDALKKSEAERQRKSVPGFADIPDARHVPRSQRWWWLLGGLLAINAAVVIGVFYVPEKQAPVAEQAPERAAPAPQAAPGEAPAQRAVPFSEIVAEARRNRPPSDAPTTTEPQRPDPAATIRPERRSSMADDLPTLDQLRGNGSLQLAELHLDIHVYSDQPAERFIFINMSKYKEGEALSEGPVVREIRPDGVVLEHSGTRFLMPRQ